MKSNNELFLLSLKEQRLHDKLLVSSDDIAIAQFCAGVPVKKGWHANPWDQRRTVYQQQIAFTTTLIMAYARAFTKSKGWPAFPPELLAYDDQEWALHRYILTLRDQVYAHSDSTRYSIMSFRLGDTPIMPTVIRRAPLRLTAAEANLFLTMTTKLLTAIKGKIQALLTTAERIPLPTDKTARSEPQMELIIQLRKGESPRKRHGLIIIEMEPEPPHLP
jgi:hypothetical protein